MKLPSDPKWVKSRQRLLHQIKQQIKIRYGQDTSWIGAYQKEYLRDFYRPWRVSNKSELMEQLQSSDIVFGGDFHPFSQAQRTHLKILRSLPARQKVVLALEIFPAKEQEQIDRYARNEISEAEFLEKISWEENWGFPWESYRPILELAKKRGFTIIGLHPENHPENPKNFDSFASRILKKVYHQTNDLIYVLAGDFHVGRNHLPKSFLSHFKGDSPKEVILYLNSERTYFQLARRGMETQIDVVKFSRRHFCVMGSPPWVKWQSYLMYLEENYDVDLEEDFDESIDYLDHVSSLIRLIGRDLGVEVKTDRLQVFTPESHNIESVIKTYLEKDQASLAQELLETNRSFFLPNAGIIVLAQTSLNHAAGLAGQYVHAQLCRRKNLMWAMPNDFNALIWIEAVGFFVSKLINHKRHAQTLTDLKDQLEVMHPKDRGRDSLLLALDQRMKELVTIYEDVSIETSYKPSDLASYIEAARFLGGMMGERLYLAYRSRRLKRVDVIKWLSKSPERKGFQGFYEEALKKLESFKPQTKSRKERL